MDWKAHCIELEQRHAAELARCNESDGQLRRALGQLAIAVDGLDPLLDPHLKSLRQVARAPASGDTDSQLTAIIDALIKSDSSALGTPRATPPDDDLFQRILQRIQQQKSSAERLKLLTRKMVSNPAAVTDGQLDELLKLIASDRSDGRRPGLLGKLFSSDSRGGKPVEDMQPNHQLFLLLEKQNWPGQLTKSIAELLARLDGNQDENAWVEVMGQLFSLLVGSLGDIQSEMLATEDFLSGLSTKQREIDQQVNESHQLREQSFEGARELNHMVSEQTSGIRQGVVSAATLDQLRADVAQHLDAIENNMHSYIEQEEQRHQLAETYELNLRERLHEVERESLELQRKVVDAHLQATTDSLTGLPNRMAYDERLVQEFARWKRFGEPLTLMVWDVDNFKQVNDRFGHKSGDQALVVIGQAMKKRLRETDFIARYGGEEFVVLLTGADRTAAETLADQVCQEVQGSGFHSGGKRVEVTASCGLSQFGDGDAPDDVFTRADKALYQAKQQGKNRYVSG